MSGETFPTPSELEEMIEGALPFPHPWAAAIHEAGHAIVSVAVGAYPQELAIGYDEERRSDGYARCGRWIDEASHWPAGGAETVASLAAGYMAEELARSDVVDPDPNDYANGVVLQRDFGFGDAPPGSDEARVLGAVGFVVGEDAGQETAFLEIELGASLAIEILVECWEDLKKVAAELYRLRRLNREQLFDLLRRSGTGEESCWQQQLRARRPE